ncbi:MAG: c-type cytochrome biogenesis protein CcsB [Elusimicrobia bacterium]|nr:c-type cytochrome biogenesis protein CcsB [Elusimicrobiota bacterium]
MGMTEMVLFNLAFAGYTLVLALYFAYAFTRRESFSRSAYRLLTGTVALHVLSLGARVLAARVIPEHTWYVPWSNWFESFSLFALLIALVFLIVQARTRLPILGVFVMPWSWLAIVMALSYPFFSTPNASIASFGGFWAFINSAREIPKLAPALQSYWMAIHVPVMFFSYSAFANAFGIGIAYLIQERQIKSKKPTELSYRLPSLEELDRLIYRIIVIAFPVLTLGIMLGARWAYDAWGRYWGWDAKETWALITWFIYLIYLHMRLVMGWRGRRTAYLSLAGFAVVIFTYVGVNYLSELHGFLSGTGR